MIILFPIHSYVNFLPKGIEYSNIILSDKDMFEECIASGNATLSVITGAVIQAVIPLKLICWHLPELLALMPTAGFSCPTNVDFHKCRHIQMWPH